MRLKSRLQVPATRRLPLGRPLLPTAVRPAATTVLVLSVLAIVVMAVLLWHDGKANWLDSAVDRDVHLVVGWRPRRYLKDIAELGSPVPVAVMTAGLVGACLALRRFRGGLLAAVSVPAAAALAELLKPIVDRRIHAGSLPGALSFPSGHVVGVFSLAVAFSVLLIDPAPLRIPRAARLLLALAGFLAAGTVAVAVIALYRHYFTDTVGGALVAVAVVLGVAHVLDLPRLRAGGSPGKTADRPAGLAAGPIWPAERRGPTEVTEPAQRAAGEGQ